MSRPARRRSRQPGSIGDCDTHARRLRMEPLEDRRMLSVTLFVDADAPTGGDGLGWDSAYRDLQAALDDAGARNGDTVGENDVDQIWIAEGVYKPSALLESGDARSASFSLLDGVTLYGGFAGTETELEGRDWSAHVTTLSGDLGTLDDSSDNAYTVVYCGAAIEAAIDGVRIVDGKADGSSTSGHSERRLGGGIYSSGTLTVINSTVSGNWADGDGGGICNNSGPLTVINSTISENSASASPGGGGGIYSSGPLAVVNSTLSGNSVTGRYAYGGGIFSTGTLTVTNSTLSGNSVNGTYSSGGGISSSGTLTVTNSTLSANSADYRGGGIRNLGTVTVTNSTLSGNSAGYGGGIHSSFNSTATLNNTIVAGNAAFSGPDIYLDAATLSGSHNLIGDGSRQWSLINGEDGNLVGTAEEPIDPLLGDRVPLGDGRWGHCLLPGSPALDAGANALAIDAAGQPLIEDLAGNPRIQNGTVDIGAVEGAWTGDPSRIYVVTSLETTIAVDGVLTFPEVLAAANQNQAVGDAPAGSSTERDIIQFAEGLSGTILVENGELVIEGDVSIEGPGAGLLTFDAEGRSRVFLVGPGASANLSGMTITGGSADEGGGINNFGTLTVANSTISANSVEGDQFNPAHGGGIYNSGTLSVINSTLSGNSANGSYCCGGGISNSGTLTVTNSTISGNSSGYRGGGVYNSGTLTVTDSALSGNSSIYGGGIRNSGTLTVINSTISGNSVAEYGGGIHNYGTLTVTNSTISGNSANDTGGIYSSGDSATATLNNTIVAGNAASWRPDVCGSLAGSHNLIGDGMNQTPLIHGIDGNQVGTPDSPIDPLLSDWTQLDNGRWGYYLLPGSPALDAGDNALAVDANGQPLTEDYSGGERIQNDTVDIGAMEGAVAGDPAQTYVVTSLDMIIAEDEVMTFLEAFEAANRNQPVGDAPAGSYAEPDVIRFAEGLSGTILLENEELIILGDLSIEGPGAAQLAFDAEGGSRVFLVKPGVSASLSGMTITGGSADRGGGIYLDHGTLAVTDSVLSDNGADEGGGGMFNDSGTLAVTNSTISGSHGRGIRNEAGTLTVINSTFSGNDGGGISNSGTLTITNSTLSGNSSEDYGGGISNSGALTVTNSTISGNSATFGGGGIVSSGNSSTTTFNNTIVAGNAASFEPDIRHQRGEFSGAFNLIGDGTGQSSLVDGVNGNQVGTSDSPIDPLLSDLAPLDNGQWGYYLLPGSPALDAGDNALALDAAGQPLTEDLSGGERIQNETVDIGALEGTAASTPGRTYVVTSLDMTIAEDEVLTFREALQAANRNQPVGDAPAGSFTEPDIIRFADGLSGTILVEDGELVIEGDLNVEGPGAELLAFDAGGRSQVFLVRASASAGLSGVTITGGSADQGGGIYNSGTLTVANSTLADNVADDGGGIYSLGTVTFVNSAISGNRAGSQGYGGGIYSTGTMTITGSTISDNSAGYAGGIYNNAGTVTVTDSTISENSTSYRYGGGIYSNDGTVTVTDSTISGNSADYDGGGIYNSHGTLTVTNSAISANSARYGGGIYSAGTLTVTNSTISANFAKSSGGGIYYKEGDATVHNTIVARNGAASGRDIYCQSVTFSGSHNLIGNGSGQTAFVHGVDGNQVGTSISPIDPLLSNWVPLGGGRWGYYLLPGSPALDAGKNELAVDTQGQPLTEDLAGNLRIQNGTVDIGSVEGTTTSRGQSYVVTSLDTTIAVDGILTFPEVLAAANQNQAVGDAQAGSSTERDVIQFAEGLHGTILVKNGGLTIQGDLSIEGPGAELLAFDAEGRSRVFLVESGASASLSGMTITGGSADDGAGIHNSGTLTVTGCVLSDNAADEGGGIFNSGTLAVANSTLSDNVAEDLGGGIYNAGTATLTGAALSENSAGYGGGIYSSGTLTATNATLSGNSATYGGGICIDTNADATTLNNTVVAKNVAMSLPDVYDSAGSLSGSHNLIGIGTGQSTLVDGEDSNQIGTSASPIDPMLSDWTRLDSGLWGRYLLPGSPAIDAGENDLAVDAQGQPLAQDLAGNPRIQDGTVDLGAVEGAATVVPGRIYVVTSLANIIADDGVLTFLEAFEAANTNQPVGDAPAGSFSDPDVIRFAEDLSGTVLVNEGELVVQGDLSIEGPGAEELAFDGRGRNRVFKVKTGTWASLSGITITGGSADSGGGIYNTGTLEIADSMLLDNSAERLGGGVYSSGTMTITGSTLSQNAATGKDSHGGGISNSGTMTLIGSTLAENSATYGGGIYNPLGTLTVEGCTLRDNAAVGLYSTGGAIHNYGALTIAGSTLSGNSSVRYGGAIYNYDGSLTITGSILSRNSSDDGGAIYNREGTLTIVGSTLADNSAVRSGGGVYNTDELAVINSTFSDNAAGRSGGGMINYRSMNVTNSIVSRNLADDYGGGIYIDAGAKATVLNNTIVAENAASFRPDVDDASKTLSGSHNLIGDGSGQSTLVDGADGNQVGTSASPIDPLLSEWALLSNGGWGYFLLPGSPAIDAGDNGLAVDAQGDPLAEDIYGNERIQDGTVDIGAVEGATVGEPAQIYVVTSLDMTIADDGVLTFLEAFEAANQNQPVGDAPAGSFSEADIIRFAEELTGTVLVDNGELVIEGDLRIEGPGAANLTFEGGGGNRVFMVETATTAGLSGMTITGGAAEDGGAIINHGTLTVADCTLTGNSATGSFGEGGVIHNTGTLNVTGSTIVDNTAGRSGGAIYSSGSLVVSKSTLWGNSADVGGAIYSSGAATVVNSTLSDNSARSGGGISNSGTLMVTNSTISGNRSSWSGGGVFGGGSSSTTTLHNTIVAGNAAISGPDVYNSSGALSGSNNLIGDSAGQSALVDGENGNQIGTSASPIDPLLSDWALLASGQWGYYLLPGSRAIDAGDNGLAVDADGQPLADDIYGNERIQDGTVDIGAVEGATIGDPAQTYVVTSLENTIADDGVLTFAEAFSAANSNQPVGDAPAGSFSEADVIQFAEGVSGTVLVDDGELVIEGDLRIEGPGAELLTFDAGGHNRVFQIKAGVSADLSGMTIADGSAEHGGGIYSCGVLAITDSALSNNSASGSGGGIFAMGALTVVDSTIWGNSAGSSGGGIYSSGGLTVINSTIADNWARSGGGISSAGVLAVTNSTLSGNGALNAGGGIHIDDDASAAVLNNTIIAGNAALSASDIDASEGILSGSYNLIGDGSGQSELVDGENGNQVGTSEAPIDPELSDWTQLDNGSWGYYLLSGSPAIDAGGNELAVDAQGQPLAEDIYGSERIQGGTVDIGAVEGATAGGPGQVYVVTSLEETIADDGVLTFLEAFEASSRNQPIGDAPAGSFSEPDVIQFAENLSGTVRVNDGELVIRGDLRIEGPGAEDLRFDAKGAGRVFQIKPGVSADFSGMTITGGSAVYGGGIDNYGLLAVADSVITGNAATGESGTGGGINNMGTLTVVDSTISDNAAYEGGGIHSSGTLTIAGSTISENSVSGQYSAGGGIHNSGMLTITGSTVTENSATGENGSGGGVYSSGTLNVTQSTLSSNSTSADFYGGFGGGVYAAGTANITNSTLSGNSAHSGYHGGFGGGVYVAGTVTIANSTLSGNSAGGGDASGFGGGILNSHRLTITNSTLAGNLAANSGGGIGTDDSRCTTTLDNTIVAGNDAPEGPDLFDVAETFSGSHNLIGDGMGQSTLVTGENGNLVGTTQAPIDPYFVRNPSDGGDGWGDDPRTRNRDESANDDYGDLRLYLDSPAIDAGDASLLPADIHDLDADGDTAEPIPFDLDGNARVFVDKVDIGAYEYPTIPGDLNADGQVGGSDLDVIRANWGQTVTPGSLIDGDPSGDGIVSGADLDIVRANWGCNAPAAAALPAESGAKLSAGDAVYGPVQRNESTSAQQQARDALFAGREALAEAAWADAVEGLRGRAKERQLAAVDRAFLLWERQ